MRHLDKAARWIVLLAMSVAMFGGSVAFHGHHAVPPAQVRSLAENSNPPGPN